MIGSIYPKIAYAQKLLEEELGEKSPKELKDLAQRILSQIELISWAVNIEMPTDHTANLIIGNLRSRAQQIEEILKPRK